MTGTATHPSLIQGISQQTVDARGTASAEDQVNCLNEVLDGVVSRMGTVLVAAYERTLSEPFVHKVRRSALEQYLLVIEDEELVILNRLTGAVCTVTGSLGDYLVHSGPARKAFQMTTVGDTTFLLNRQVETAMATTKSPVRPNYACAYFRAGGYKVTYTLTIRVDATNFTVSHTTPDNSASDNSQYITTDHLAEQFRLALGTTVFPAMVTAGYSGFSAARYGSTIIISGPAATEFTVRCTDGVGDTHLKAFVDTVDGVSDLPKKCVDGYVVSISPTGSADSSRYWLRYTGDTDTGRWNEVVSPDTVLGVDPNTMPHLIVCTGVDTFEAKASAWGSRVSGDGGQTSPDPSFIGLPVRSLQFLSGRLASVSEYTAVLSRARNAFVLFPDTAQTDLDTAPIDYDISNGSSTNVEHTIVAGQRLQFWSDGQQTYLDSGNDAISEDTTEVLPLANYEYDGECAPEVMGLSSLVFGTSVGKWAKVTEVMLQRSQAVGEITITAHVPKLLRGALRRIAIGEAATKAFYLTTDAPTKCYLYQWYNQGQDRVQSAWNVWEFNGVEKVLWVDIHGATATFLLSWGDHFTLETTTMDAFGDEDPSLVPLRLDHRVSESLAEYDTLEGGWLLQLPYPVTENRRHHFDAFERSTSLDGLRQRGSRLRLDWVDDHNVWIRKPDPDTEFYFGAVPVARRKESPFRARDRNDEPIIHDNLVLRELIVNHADTVAYDIVINALDHPEIRHTYTSRILGDPAFVNQDIPLRTGTHSGSIGAKTEEVEIELVNDTPFPARWTSMKYVYELTVRHQ